ncbi:unnamed protein product [Rhizophagus irregularis]|nr:unnamed protein product [Rhizophagus irregularis]
MENLELLKSIIRQNDYMVSIDLNQAFFHVPLAVDQQPYFSFDFQNRRFCFTCLPFSLTTSPRDKRRSVTTVKGSYGYLRKNGIYNQQRKVNARTLSIDRVSRLQDQHKDDDLYPPADKSKGPSERMQKSSTSIQNTCLEAGVSNRKDIGNNVSCFSSSSLLQSSAPRQKLWSETAQVERYSTALQRKQVAARVVDKKSPFLEWKKFNPGRTKYHNSHRCVKYRLECVPEQLDHPQKLDSVGVNSSHQYSGTEGDSVLHSCVQGASESNDIDSNRQHDVCSLYQPSGQDDISGSLKDRREFVDIMPETQSKIDSGTHSRHNKCGSGSSIKDDDRKERMEVTSQNLQRIQQDMRSLSIGSICKQNQHPTSPLLCMENGSVC